jgi:uncharacterized protein (TIGR03083 family)
MFAGVSLDPRSALDAECHAIAAVLSKRPEADFERVSNCAPWTLKELAVHVWGTIQMPSQWIPAATSPTAAPDYYRRAERETDAYRQLNVERSRRAAARYPTGRSAAEALREAADDVTDRLQREDMEQVVEVAGVGAMRLRDYLVTRVASVAIHGLDVAITLDEPPFTTPIAEQITVGLLEELIGEEAKQLGWSSQELIARASGRTTLTSAERARLGDLAGRFPVVS